jgi:hypothetical protein
MPRAKTHSAAGATRPAGAARSCDRPDCQGEGVYRAPKSRDALNSHMWLCLDHIREFNKSWDYFAGMSTDQIEAHVRRDIVGWRPTWPLGRLSAQQAQAEERTARNGPKGSGTRGTSGARAKAATEDPFARAHDPFGFFDENGPAAGVGGRKGRGKPGSGATPEQNKALRTMGLQWPLSQVDLKRRYKELAKRLHPDANGGDKAAEERLKLVNQAYATLKNSVSAT